MRRRRGPAHTGAARGARPAHFSSARRFRGRYDPQGNGTLSVPEFILLQKETLVQKKDDPLKELPDVVKVRRARPPPPHAFHPRRAPTNIRAAPPTIDIPPRRLPFSSSARTTSSCS